MVRILSVLWFSLFAGFLGALVFSVLWFCRCFRSLGVLFEEVKPIHRFADVSEAKEGEMFDMTALTSEVVTLGFFLSFIANF